MTDFSNLSPELKKELAELSKEILVEEKSRRLSEEKRNWDYKIRQLYTRLDSHDYRTSRYCSRYDSKNAIYHLDERENIEVLNDRLTYLLSVIDKLKAKHITECPHCGWNQPAELEFAEQPKEN